MKKNALIMIGLLIILLPHMCFAFDHQHGIWDIIMKKHVVMKDGGHSSRVDYKGIKNDRALFNTYLSELSSVSRTEFDSWSKKQQLAFLINAYNAFTIDLILKHYPVKSIKDIGSLFKTPWQIEFIPLFGKTWSLDQIEHQMIRKKGVFDEPRIHAALVCASIGCPALRNVAYTEENIDTELEQAMINFLSDKSRNRFIADKNRFQVSPIFKWYEDDFKLKYGSLLAFFNKYGESLVSRKTDLGIMKHGKSTIEFLDYDWKLNDL